MRSKFLCSLLLLSSYAVAQAPQQLTELESTKLELLSTKIQLLQVQLSEVQQAGEIANKAMQDEIIAIETAHPGYMVDKRTGTLVAKQVVTPPAKLPVNPTGDPKLVKPATPVVPAKTK